MENHERWSEGPTWLRNPSEWPTDVILESTPETRAEAKVKREILATEEDEFDPLIGKYSLPKVLRVGAWIQRFIDNCRVKPKDRKCGPVETEEVQRVKLWWI